MKSSTAGNKKANVKTKFNKRRSRVNQTRGAYGNLPKSIPLEYDASLKLSINKYNPALEERLYEKGEPQ